MKGYEQYIKDVKSGKIVTSQYIKQAVERFERLRQREDIYFDASAVDDCIEFISQMKHFLGSSAGKNFNLEPWQQMIIAHVIGLKWKSNGLRITRDLFVLIARKNGKSSLIAALALYMLIADGEVAPYISCVASSRDQAGIIFNMIKEYGKTLDPKGDAIKHFRNYINFPSNMGTVKVFSSDSAKLDGLNVSLGILDEGHAQKDNLLYSVMKSSMGQRSQPLMVQITTAGFLTEGYPCFETYKLSIELLAGVKEDDTFATFLYCLDPEDNFEDERVWIKANPNLDVTISSDFLRGEVLKAKNDSTQLVPVKTKNFNIFCNSRTAWIPQEKVAKVMDRFNLEDFAGNTCYIGLDLASVGDMTSMAILIPYNSKYYFRTYSFVPEETYENSPNHELYQRFYQDGDLIVTPGNVTDYQYITNMIVKIGEYMNIEGIYFDPFNSSQLQIQLTQLGMNMQPCRQGLLAFSNPTKEFERLVLSEQAVIYKSTVFLWSVGCVVLRVDHNSNCKPDKATPNNKIDPVIASIQALSGYMGNPMGNDFEIFVL